MKPYKKPAISLARGMSLRKKCAICGHVLPCPSHGSAAVMRRIVPTAVWKSRAEAFREEMRDEEEIARDEAAEWSEAADLATEQAKKTGDFALAEKTHKDAARHWRKAGDETRAKQHDAAAESLAGERKVAGLKRLVEGGTLQTGARGGRFVVTATGRKVYIK